MYPQVQIVAVSKLLSDVNPAYVEVYVESGGRRLYETAQRTRSVLTDVTSVPKFYTKWDPKDKTKKITAKKQSQLRDVYWNEWMSLPVTFNELPRNSKLMFTLYDDSESSNALASASLSLFTEKNTLRQGLQRMELTFTSYAREIVLRALNPSLFTSAPPPSTPSPSAPPTTATSTTATSTTDLYDEMFLLDKRLEAYRIGWGLGHRSGTTHPDSSVVVPGVSHSAILRENRWLNNLMLDRVRAIERANLAAEDVVEESLNPNSFLVIQLPHFKSPIVYAERPYVMDSDSVSKRLNETWVEETEPFTGRSYFSNTKTHACQWAAPKGVVVRSSVLEDLEDEEEKEEDDAMMVARWRRRLGMYLHKNVQHSLTH